MPSEETQTGNGSVILSVAPLLPIIWRYAEQNDLNPQ